MKMQKAFKTSAWILSALMATLVASSADAGLKYWTTGRYDADSYVQDGLVLNYDGIRNVGIDQPHSMTTTTWVNLANPGTQDLTKSGSGKNSKWLSDGFFFDGTNCFKNSGLTIAGPRYTTQTLIDAKASDHVAKGNIGYVFFTLGDSNNNWTKWSLAVRNSTTDGVWFNTHYYTSDRPKIKNTDAFSYLTMIANDTYTAIFSGLAEPTGTPGRYGLKSGTTAIGSFTSDGWGIGGNPNGGTQQLIGTIKSLRHYNRVLSLEERTWNRSVDEYRFFGKPVSLIPVTNVVLASSIACVGGNEKAGAYAVDAAGYTFTAPASQAANGRTYACTGYTLETWDGTAWGAAVAHDGETSYAASDNGLVRLTWQWAAGDGLVTYDTGDYVQDGLLLHYDGIANVGADMPHSGDANAWYNLAPNGGWNMAFHINTSAGSQPGEWRYDGYRFEGASWFAPGVAFALPSNQTIQIAIDGNGLDQDAYNGAGTWVNEPYLYYANATFNKAGSISLRRDNKATGNEWFDWTVHGYGDENTRPSACQPNGTPLHYVTTVLADTFGAAFLGTTVPTKETSRWTTFASRRDFTAGPPTVQQAANFYIGGLAGTNNNRQKFRGIINNFRMYNRVLTDEELSHNRMVDDYRFHGIMPVTNVVVATSHSFFSGNERCFNYQISGSYTFSASAETRTDSRGVEYAFDGYTLETWDAATRDWSAPVAYAGSTYTWTAGTSPAKVRLTWRWKATRGLRTAADYGLEDIVPNGLVLHYDGKKNVGVESADVTNPTSAWSRAWANLADTRVYNLTLYRKTTSAGGWTDCGYAFTNKSSTVGGSFKHEGLFTFTPHYSLQVLVDACANDQVNATCGYLMFNSPWQAASMAIRTSTDYNYAMYYVADHAYNGDARPKITNASRTYSYATAIINGKTATLFEGTEAPTSGDKADGYYSSTRTALATNVTKIAIGGNGGSGTQDFTGTLKAFRYYDRVLTTDEMVRNRNVDSVRYFGALATTNVFVVAGGEGAVQAETGAYKVEGEWTFTAATTVNRRGETVPVVRYSVETLVDGEWSGKTYHDGGSYTYTEGASPETVRLKWLGEPIGTTVVIQ